MPIFYNSGFPTPTSKNTINSVAVVGGIRDFLLNLNLLPQYPQIPTTINGSPKIGEPVLDTVVGTGNVLIPIGLPLETNGIIWKDLNVIYNTFQNDSSLANNLEEIDFIPALSNPDFGSAVWPANIQYPTGANPDVEFYGIKGKTEYAQYRKSNVTKNLYLDSTSQIDVADFITLTPLDISQQLGNYVDVFGGLNEGGTTGDQAINVIGSVLNGQGVGLGAGGSVIPNFDFKSSLAGRVLGAAGFVKDTKLGNIGAQQLALALANNAAFNVQQELLGALNIKENIYSLIKDGDLAGFRPSYKITVASSTGGKLLTGSAQILGFQIPRSYLGDEGSIFQSENGDSSNIDRANSMILNTGKGQVKSLISGMLNNLSVNSVTTNPFRSGYAPAFKNNKGDEGISVPDSKLYAFSKEGKVNKILGNTGDVIPEINYNREAFVEDSGFKSPEQTYSGPFGNSGYNDRKISQVGFTWTTGNGDSVNSVKDYDELDTTGTILDKKSLLAKTQKLFNSKGMKTLVSVKGEMGYNSTQIQSANNNGISKGSAVLSEANYNLSTGQVGPSAPDADGTFCRSWTTLNRYDSVQKLIRKRALYQDPVYPYRHKTKGSVLDGPFVKIAPYSDDKVSDPKKYMFSIENLAWAGDPFNDLPSCEQGPGDLISGKRGRIMWFPPYDIQFSENNTVNWEETNFIGRGEPVYTYNNTKRSGQLSFKIIVDHPSYYNAFRGTKGPDDNYIASFFAGCIDVDQQWGERLTKTQKDTIETTSVIIPQPKSAPIDPCQPDTLTVYFPNDIKDYVPAYEDGKSGSTVIDYSINCDGFGCGLNSYSADTTQKLVDGKTTTWPDRYDYGLNAGKNSTTPVRTDIEDKTIYGYNDADYSSTMVTFLKKYPWAVVNFKGYASPQGNPNANTSLAETRAKNLRDKLAKDWGSQLGQSEDIIKRRFVVLPAKALTKSDVPDCPVESTQSPNPPTDILACKLARKVEISVTFDQQLKSEITKSLFPKPPITDEERFNVRTEILNKMYTECDYFERMVADSTDENGNVVSGNKFIFDNIREKIKYFHPAFHSTTPEGLNSRLTFLLQCTRQGPTLEEFGANNLAFGRPPVCILRIGDFYHTKIVIENVNIGYEPLVWDLNPEGVGVQPMIANVDISFNFLGGSSLMGPINKLQNALSFNYFANTHVYDPRADYIAIKPPVPVGTVLESSTDVSALETNSNNIKYTEPGGYRIIDGVKKYEPKVTELKRKLIQEELKIDDQISQDEAVNSGLENTVQPPTVTTTATTENDTKVIKGFNIDSYLKIDETQTEDLDIDFQFQFYPIKDTNVVLTKSYTGNMYIENTTTKKKELVTKVYVNPNTSTSVFFKIGDNEEPIALDGKIKINFSLQAVITDNINLVTFIKETYNTNGSILKIEWETPSGESKVQVNWNKTLAKASFA